MLMDPSGNRTILVETPVPAEQQPAVAARLMRLEPTAEQVGFIAFRDDSGAAAAGRSLTGGPASDASKGAGTKTAARAVCDLSLRMAGGEFCGNASMSAATLFAMRGGIFRGSGGRVILDVSGTEDPVCVSIESVSDGVWKGVVDMPLPESVKLVRFPDGRRFPVVSFPGISHVIMYREKPSEEAESFIKEWCGYLQADALGILFLEADAPQAEFPDGGTAAASDGLSSGQSETARTVLRASGRLVPLVYVPAADTLFWEKACGSGTAAAGAWLARERGRPVSLRLQQPGGVLEVAVSPEGALSLTGEIRYLHRKAVSIH